MGDYKATPRAKLAKLLAKLRFLKLPKRSMDALEQCESRKAAEKQRETHLPEPRAAARDQRRIAARRFQSQDRGARRHGAAAFPAGARERQDKFELQGRCGSPLFLEFTRGPCRGSSSPHTPSRDGRPSDALWGGRIKEGGAP